MIGKNKLCSIIQSGIIRYRGPSIVVAVPWHNLIYQCCIVAGQWHQNINGQRPVVISLTSSSWPWPSDFRFTFSICGHGGKVQGFSPLNAQRILKTQNETLLNNPMGILCCILRALATPQYFPKTLASTFSRTADRDRCPQTSRRARTFLGPRWWKEKGHDCVREVNPLKLCRYGPRWFPSSSHDPSSHTDLLRLSRAHPAFNTALYLELHFKGPFCTFFYYIYL